MSNFGKRAVVRTTVSYDGTNFITARGLASVLARDATRRLLFSNVALENKAKYGSYSVLGMDRDLIALWRENESRLKKRFYKRILPLVKPLFKENNR